MAGIGAERRKKAKKPSSIDVPPVPSVAEAVKAVESGPEKDGEGADGLSPEYSFTLDAKDSRGRTWRGDFQAHVLTVHEKAKVGLIMAQLTGGAPIASLDTWTRSLYEMLSLLAVAIDSGPEWAADLGTLHAVEVVQSIYEEVASYEARFHATRPGDAGSGADADAGGDG